MPIWAVLIIKLMKPLIRAIHYNSERFNQQINFIQKLYLTYTMSNSFLPKTSIQQNLINSMRNFIFSDMSDNQEHGSLIDYMDVDDHRSKCESIFSIDCSNLKIEEDVTTSNTKNEQTSGYFIAEKQNQVCNHEVEGTGDLLENGIHCYYDMNTQKMLHEDEFFWSDPIEEEAPNYITVDQEHEESQPVKQKVIQEDIELKMQAQLKQNLIGHLRSFKLRRREIKKVEKNVNIPKFVGRLLLKYFSLYKSYYERCTSAQKEQLFKNINKLEDWIKLNKNNTFKLKHLQEFFGGRKYCAELSKINRAVMHEILSKYLRDEILSNNQIKDKEVYLISSKVYAMRLKNDILALRMQFK